MTDNLDLVTKKKWFTIKNVSSCKEAIYNIMLTWFEQLTPHIDNFFAELHIRIPGNEIHYIRIFPRPWWSALTRKFADRLDKYILLQLGHICHVKKFKVKELYQYKKKLPKACGITDHIHAGLTEMDQTQLSIWGYRVFCWYTTNPLLYKWFQMQEQVAESRCNQHEDARRLTASSE